MTIVMKPTTFEKIYRIVNEFIKYYREDELKGYEVMIYQSDNNIHYSLKNEKGIILTEGLVNDER